VESQNSILTVIAEKMLLTHAKPLIKSKAAECVLGIFEASEVFDESIETI